MPFQQDGSIQDKMQVECFGFVGYCDNLLNTGAWLHRYDSMSPDGIVPEREPPLATLLAISLGVFQVLAFRIELLYADEIGNV